MHNKKGIDIRNGEKRELFSQISLYQPYSNYLEIFLDAHFLKMEKSARIPKKEKVLYAIVF